MRNLDMTQILVKFVFILVLCYSSSVVSDTLRQGDQTDSDRKERALSILRQIDDLWRDNSSHAIFTMQVKTAHYERNMRLEGWSKGKEKTLVKILQPLKEKGTATLKSGNSIYTYLPRTDRTIRLTSGMMMGSWMGSHFTNDDLIKESRMEDDYNPTITFEGKRNDKNIIEFTLSPKPDAVVVWGKIVLTVNIDDYLPIKELYYDEDMVVARTMTFNAIKQLGGRARPTRMRIEPADKPNEFTELVYEKLELNIPIEDHFFSLSQLRRN